ncbi:MAG: hypothetical protein ABF242_00090 [Flavobacteriales bacterium]
MNKKTINIVAVLTMIGGAFGMLFCFPFLWSANMPDLVGAGFPFVGGAILFGSGLVSLVVNNRNS